ncbi:hypothetical protein [Streptomyces graminilatus]|uniref:hypothetical protein n=1 Tax=Streptomyces graminilatus TaxID=1464070 RepID=UPI0006E41479|nr:hypothetical protein [Streptomyces graminilatus]
MNSEDTVRGAAVTTTPCRACRTPKPVRMYLCADCWDRLPRPARRALTRRDGQALARLRALHTQLDAGTPLPEITADLTDPEARQ